jgi:hypothetical protein
VLLYYHLKVGNSVFWREKHGNFLFLRGRIRSPRVRNEVCLYHNHADFWVGDRWRSNAERMRCSRDNCANLFAHSIFSCCVKSFRVGVTILPPSFPRRRIGRNPAFVECAPRPQDARFHALLRNTSRRKVP